MEGYLCDECGSRIIKENGMQVCQKCGLVHDIVLEASSFQLGSVSQDETRKNQQYTSINNRLNIVSSLGSSIGTVEEYMFRDANGLLLNEVSQMKFRKFKNYYHIPGAIKGKETDYRTIKILNEVFSRLQIPTKIRDRTLFLYYKYKKEHSGEITNHVLLSAMTLLLSVRESGHNCPLTLKEIVETYRELGHRVLGKNLLGLMQDLNIKSSFTGVRRSEEYVFRICSLICRSSIIKERIAKKYSIDVYVYEKILQLMCLKILERIPYADRGGRRPYPLSAAAAYVADKLLSKKIKHSSALTQKLVAKSTSVAEFTIRDHAEFMFSYNFDDIVSEISQRLSSSFA
jgi:transcription initiation factor TFIIIB Brf1 subunit/transcription initiation factor TFIIB